MRKLKKHISVFLLLISSLFIVPKELWHEFSFHEDTIDHCSPVSNNDLTLGSLHHHCDILDVFVQPFQASSEDFLISETIKLISHSPYTQHTFSFELIDFIVIRGPPITSCFC